MLPSEQHNIDRDPEALRAANLADLLLEAHSPEAMQLASSLSEETVLFLKDTGTRQRGFKTEARDRFDRTVGALLGDLTFAATNRAAERYCYRSSNRDAFKHTVAESRHYDALKNAWRSMGLIEVVDGFRGTDDFDGAVFHPDTPSSNWATRLRATPKLLDRLIAHGIEPFSANLHFKRSLPMLSPVLLRKSKNEGGHKGDLMTLPKGPKLDRMSAEVSDINAYLSDQVFSFGPPPYLYRSFNNGNASGFDWNFGGRFYASGNTYLSWPKEDRFNITINGSRTRELDISACQLTMLYGLTDTPIDANSDFYLVDDVPRETVKKTISIWVGRGCAPELSEVEVSSDKRAPEHAAILRRHPVLRKLQEEGWDSLKLQAVESDMMSDTLLKLGKHYDIPALPIHDCILVREEDAETAKSVLSEVFNKTVGVTPTIK